MGQLSVSLNNLLISIDKKADYIPGVSTVTNAVDLIAKRIISTKKQDAVKKSNYYTHLNNKSSVRCIILLIPFIGNLLIGIFDFCKYKKDVNDTLFHIRHGLYGYSSLQFHPNLKNQKKYVLAFVKANGLNLKFASNKLKDDYEVISAAGLQNPLSAEFFGPKHRNNKELALRLCEINGFSIQHFSDDLKDDEEVVSAAGQQNPLSAKFFGQKQRNNKDLALRLCEKNRLSIQHFSDNLKDDEEVGLAACNQYGGSLSYLSLRLKNNRNIVEAAVENYGHSLSDASEDLRKDQDIVIKASLNAYSAISLAHEDLKKNEDFRSKLKEKNSNAYDYLLGRRSWGSATLVL
jgi:hypothetical protein